MPGARPSATPQVLVAHFAITSQPVNTAPPASGTLVASNQQAIPFNQAQDQPAAPGQENAGDLGEALDYVVFGALVVFLGSVLLGSRVLQRA
jgi:hypothetical protein